MSITERAPIFIHSGFRVASTWLWNHFRERSAFVAYYEIFNEDLATLTSADVRAKTWASWRSRHPATPPYFLEFLPLIEPEGGVRNFVPEPEFGSRFIPVGGLNGTLYPEESTYIDGLISAVTNDRIPVLSCTRTLGKIAAIKKQFGGTHILLRRNLFRQWNSFSGQHRTGNLYFIVSFLNFIFNNKEEKFFKYLMSILPDIGKIESSLLIENNYDDVFTIFVAWHIYLIISGERSSDIVINIDRLTDIDGIHRAQSEQAINDATGQYVLLNDARDTIDLPWQPIIDVESVRMKIDMLVERACVELNATIAERAEADIMVSDLWREHDHFVLYSSIITERVADVEEKNRILSETLRDEQDKHDKALNALMANNIALQEGMAKQDQLITEERQRGMGAVQLVTEQLSALYHEIKLDQQEKSDELPSLLKSLAKQTRTQTHELNDLIKQAFTAGRDTHALIEQGRAEDRNTHELIQASYDLILQGKAFIERLECAHAEEIARLNAELASVRAWGAANGRSLHRLIAERERDEAALEQVHQQNAARIIAIAEEAADTVRAITCERDEARTENAALKDSLAAAHQRNEQQNDALEAMLNERIIERVSRAELAAERDAALRDQATAFESQLGVISNELDAARRALEQLKEANNFLNKRSSTSYHSSLFSWLRPINKLLSRVSHSR